MGVSNRRAIWQIARPRYSERFSKSLYVSILLQSIKLRTEGNLHLNLIRRTQPHLRRLLLLALLLLALTALAACGRDEEPAAPAAVETWTPTAEGQTAAAAETPAPADAGAQVDPSARAGDLDPDERNGMYSAPPPMTIDPEKYYYATLQTEKGDIKLQLFADRAPITVNNFVFLAREGFYDNTTFHRVLEGFMAQAGDPSGTGGGGPGYMFEDEIVEGLVFDRPNLLAMANAGPGTNGSQFFITFAATQWLDGMHTIFGEVIEGQDVLAALTRRDPDQNPTEPGDLIQTVVIEESDSSVLPTPTPLPPPTPTPTPFAPTDLDAGVRPLATVTTTQKSNYFNTAPEMTIDTARQYTATITTTKGDLIVALNSALAPQAVNNFVVLADLGFYDSMPINQVNPDELVVIGSPGGTTDSDAGYKFYPEINIPVQLQAGAVAYVPYPTGPADLQASGSQLLLAIASPPAEAGSFYSFFGQIVEGLEVLRALTSDDSIETVTIEVSE